MQKGVSSLELQPDEVEVQYNGPHKVATRRGEVTNRRYSCWKGKCLTMKRADYEVFAKRNPYEFTLCESEAEAAPSMEDGLAFMAAMSQLPEVRAQAEEEQAIAPTPVEVLVADQPSVASLTIAEATPIIKAAGLVSISGWIQDEQERTSGPRQTILSALFKRRKELIEAQA